MTENAVSHVSSEAERTRRYAGLRKIMDEQGLEALLICGRSDESVRGRIQYVSDIFQWAGTGFVVLPRRGDPVFIDDPLWSLGYASQSGWVTDLRTSDAIGREIGGILSDLGLGKSEIGIVGFDVLSVGDYDLIRSALPAASLRNATDLFDDFRTVKSQEEVDNIYQTCAILRTVFDALKAEIRPGVQQRVVMAHAYRLARQYGCMFGIALIGATPSRVMAPQSSRLIEKDNVIVIDLEWGGPSNYWAELRRCYSFGPPSDTVRRYFDTRVEAFAACVAAMKAGNSSREILVARDRVYAKYQQTAPELNYTAHGIGVDALEPPWVPGKERILEENMVISLHPGIRFTKPEQAFAVGSVSVSDNVLVGRNGGIRMADQQDTWVVLDA